MRFLEFQAKRLLEFHGIKTPRSVLYGEKMPDFSPPYVLKAQIPSGGRGKAGGVLFAENDKELKDRADSLLKGSIKGFPVKHVLVEEKLRIEREFFVSFMIDASVKREILIFSSEGGVDIEELAKKEPRKIRRLEIRPFYGFQDYEVREILDVTGKNLLKLSSLILKLYRIFHELDATILEVNPLVLTEDGYFVVADVHLEIEDEALKRHPELGDMVSHYEEFIGTREMTEMEKRAREIDNLDHRGVAGRFIEFDGNLGLLIGGGGASLTVFDAIRKYGGKPANYCEIGGNPSVKKVAELTKLLLSKPGVEKIAVIMNVVSNTRVDLVARGVIKGILESGKDPKDVITVFRIPGAWEDEGFKILKKYGVKYLTREYSLDDAARMAVQGWQS